MRRILFIIYQWLIAAPIILVLTIITALLTMIGGLFSKQFWGYWPSKIWSRCWCTLLGVRVRVEGRQNIDKNKNYVFVANHQGAFDIFSISGWLGHNFRWMMRKGLTNIPLIGTACRAAGHILVDHKSPAGLLRTKADAEKLMAQNTSLVVFPEGRRTADGHMGQFKNGAFRLAVEFNLPVVPITINGSYERMPRSTFNVTPGTIFITIHEPINPPAQGHDIHNLMINSQQAIESALPQQNRRKKT